MSQIWVGVEPVSTCDPGLRLACFDFDVGDTVALDTET